MAQALASRLNLPNVLQTDIIHEVGVNSATRLRHNLSATHDLINQHAEKIGC